MNWSGKRVTVTGGAGFIGSHLCEALVAAGASVRVFTRYSSNGIQGALRDVSENVFNELEIIAGDLRDPSGVEASIAGADVVFHLAAHIGIPYSYVHPIDVLQVNVNGTANVLEACRRNNVSKVVVFSTSETYGTAQYAPIDEAHPLHPQSPYAASKVGADQLALSYQRSFDLPVAICRPFNTYGPRQPARAVLPTIIVQALGGEVIRLGSLTPTRDLVFASDTAKGAIRIAEEDASIGEVINLATGQEVSVGDLANTIIEIFGNKHRIEIDQSRVRPDKSEVFRLLGDATKAKEMLGWSAEVSLSEGLDQTIAWVKRNKHAFAETGYRI